MSDIDPLKILRLKNLHSKLTFENVIYFKKLYGSINTIDESDIDSAIKVLDDIVNSKIDPIKHREELISAWSTLEDDEKKNFEGLFSSINNIHDNTKISKCLNWIFVTIYNRNFNVINEETGEVDPQLMREAKLEILLSDSDFGDTNE